MFSTRKTYMIICASFSKDFRYSRVLEVCPPEGNPIEQALRKVATKKRK
jgi:hypothetical protein